MKSDIIKFFGLGRQIFGICPECNNFFRLSDCKIFLKKRPVPDWMDEISLNEMNFTILDRRRYMARIFPAKPSASSKKKGKGMSEWGLPLAFDKLNIHSAS
jgi:hypothetical protein